MVTSAQHQVYQYICECLEKAYSPSLREIAIGIGLSPLSKSIVSRHVQALMQASYISRDQNGFHDLRNDAYQQNRFTLPIVGRIAAGKPIEAVSQQEVLDLSAILHQDGCYVLEVKGDSMIGEGIWDGDRVICKTANIAKQDDIAVVLIDQTDATLKRIRYQQDKTISLIPANPQYKTQIYTPERVTVQGIFIGLLRLPRRN